MYLPSVQIHEQGLPLLWAPLSPCCPGLESCELCWAQSTDELLCLQKPLNTLLYSAWNKYAGAPRSTSGCNEGGQTEVQALKGTDTGSRRNSQSKQWKKIIKNGGSILCHFSKRPWGLGICLAKAVGEILALEMFETKCEKNLLRMCVGIKWMRLPWVFGVFFPYLTLWKTPHPRHDQTIFQCQLGPDDTTEAGLGTSQSLEILLQWFSPQYTLHLLLF